MIDADFYLRIQTTIIAIVTVINFILASLIFLRNREKSSLYFIGTVLGITFWNTGILLYIQPGIHPYSIYISSWNYVWGGLISYFFMFFGLYFGEEDRKISRYKIMMATGVAIIVSLFAFMPDSSFSIVSAVKEEVVGGINGVKIKSEVFGPAYPIFTVYILLFFSIGFFNLAKRFKKSEGIFRTRLLYIFTGSIVATLFAITTNLFMPYLFQNSNLTWLGPVGTLTMIVGVTYAITRHGLWDFKLVAMELFTSLLVIVLFIQMLFSVGIIAQIINGASFFFMLFFGYYLIRGMLEETESRERIERLAENLSAANKRLLELDVEKSDFVSIASHQLRTPLTVIKGYASMLLEGSFGIIKKLNQREAVDKIYQASERLVLMIEEFLNISRIEKGDMVYNMARMDFRELVKEVTSDFATALKGEKLELAFDSPRAEDFYITGDHLKLRQVVSNIIDNAIKYTPAGGKIEIKLTRDEKEGSIIFSVTDNGIGLTREALEKLFQKFSRAKGMSKLHTEGRGLGLYVAKQIVEAHGGELRAYSAGKDQGSTFTAILPDMGKGKGVRSFKEEGHLSVS